MKRSSSCMSTNEGSFTPITDTSTPTMRLSDISSGAVSISLGLQRCVSMDTNLARIRISPNLRLDEYLFDGSMDLAFCYFDHLRDLTKAIRLLIFQRFGITQLTMLALVAAGSPLIHESASDHFPLVHPVLTHSDSCSCATCDDMIQFLISSSLQRLGHDRLSRFAFLERSELIQRCGLKLSSFAKNFSPMGGIILGVDSISKKVNNSNTVLVCILRLLNRGATLNCINSHLRGAPIVSLYSSRVYRIKKIRFDLKPCDKFFNTKTNRLVSFADHVESSHGYHINDNHSPMIEVFPDKRSEICLVIPETMCMLSQSSGMPHKNRKLSPRARRAVVDNHISTLNRAIDPSLMEIERIQMEGSLISASSRFSPLPVARASILWVLYMEDPTRFSPNCIASFIEGIQIGPPVEIVTNLDHIVQKPDLVLCVINGDKHTYSCVKFHCFVEMGVNCQVVRRETFLRRGRINDCLNSIARQIDMKLGLSDGFSGTTMTTRIGLDFHRYGSLCVYAVSMGYGHGQWKVAYRLGESTRENCGGEFPVEVFDSLVRELISGVPINNSNPVVVFYASRQKVVFGDRSSTERIGKEIPDKIREMTGAGTIFVDCSLHTDCRFFYGHENPPIGFSVDSSTDSFYLVPHVVSAGTAKPIHCRVTKGCDVAWGMDAIKQYVFDQCLEMNGDSQRCPAPLIHTLKIAELLGIYFRQVYRGQNRELLFALKTSSNWQELCRSGKPFYL